MVEDGWYSVAVPILEYVHENGDQMAQCCRRPGQVQGRPGPAAAQRGGADAATAPARPVAAPPPLMFVHHSRPPDRRTDGTASQGELPHPPSATGFVGLGPDWHRPPVRRACCTVPDDGRRSIGPTGLKEDNGATTLWAP
jgi:hypothetical protein